MLDKHPVQTLFEHLTQIVSHALPSPEHYEGKCSCCGRDASEFGYQAYRGEDGYKTPYMHCAACESFNVGDINVLGIERNETTLPDGSKSGVSHKFGMLAGTGALIQSDGSVTVFTPQGTYKKLPESFLSRFNVVECSSFKQITHLANIDLQYPLLYIQDFGKKTKQLITGLRYSLSAEAVIACSDNGNSSTTEFINTFDLNVVSKIVDIAQAMPLSLFKSFKAQLAAMCLGGKTPEEFSDFMHDKGTDEMMGIYRLLPRCPHSRLAIMDMVLKIKGA